MSETIAVNCNSCGASLEVEQSTRFVTCMHCGTKLEIKRNDSSVFTQVLEQIQQSSASTARDVEIIRLEKELERIDREWQATYPQMPIAAMDGSVKTGSTGGAVALIIFMIIWLTICGIMIAGMLGASYASGTWPLGCVAIVPALMAVLGVVVMGRTIMVALGYKPAINAHQHTLLQNRNSIMQEINSLRV